MKELRVPKEMNVRFFTESEIKQAIKSFNDKEIKEFIALQEIAELKKSRSQDYLIYQNQKILIVENNNAIASPYSLTYSIIKYGF